MREIEKALEKIRKDQKDIGVATESLNRLPIFQPTLKPKFEVRSFENRHGRITVKGKLGQNHKTLLETILYKRKAYDLRINKDENKATLRILYNEHEVRRYLSVSKYSYEGYRKMIEDMITTYVKLETEKAIIEGTLIARKLTAQNYSYKTRSNLPNIVGKEIPYAVIEFGDLATLLILKELRFTYDPKPLMKLSGISQSVVRYLRTHKNHPSVGYHLKALIENLTTNVEGQAWKDIRRSLRRDAEILKSLGITIDFGEDRLYVA
jgi:hypothetical protein